jgi:dipeptidase D
MNTTIAQLEPQALWRNFAKLNAVPRASKKEERVIAFMKQFGESLGLETFVDEVGNVIIKKPATKGMEDRKTIVMQSHLDMVHQKNNDTNFDFDTQGIEMYVEGDWVKAKGTTLGADNGLGVATIMAILESDTISHPAIEALFTIDEETGMTGAKGLKGGLLNGEILLNLDTEEDNELGVGCAGGIDVTATLDYNPIKYDGANAAYHIEVKGLNGGHSGMDIHKGLGNANKLLMRLLLVGQNDYGMQLASIDGGGLRNAIPREAKATVVVANNKKNEFESALKTLTDTIKKEYKTLEPNLNINITTSKAPKNVMPVDAQERLIKSLSALWNGVYRMSPDIPDLVETSNNLARVLVADGKAQIGCLTRSSVESSKMDLAHNLKACLELGGCEVTFSGDYPGWTPNMDSPILAVMERLYETLNGTKPHVAACHAGLECGILGTHYPDMDMISFGPNIKGAHSPDERAQISSVQKYWKYVLAVLKEVPKK